MFIHSLVRGSKYNILSGVKGSKEAYKDIAYAHIPEWLFVHTNTSDTPSESFTIYIHTCWSIFSFPICIIAWNIKHFTKTPYFNRVFVLMIMSRDRASTWYPISGKKYHVGRNPRSWSSCLRSLFFLLFKEAHRHNCLILVYRLFGNIFSYNFSS